MKEINLISLFFLAILAISAAPLCQGMQNEAYYQARPACSPYKNPSFQSPSLMGIPDDLKRTVIKTISKDDNAFAAAITLSNLKQVNKKFRHLVSTYPLNLEAYRKPIKAYNSLILREQERAFFLSQFPKTLTNVDVHRKFLDHYLELCQSKMNYGLSVKEYENLRAEFQRIARYLGFQKEIIFDYKACLKGLDTVYIALTK